jgi:putative pyruvate formate lyase activating enzyme
VVDWVSETFPRGEVFLSIMRQFTPAGRLKDTPPFHRSVTEDEYAAVCSWAELCGIKNGFYQEEQSADGAYIPQFHGTWEDILRDI